MSRIRSKQNIWRDNVLTPVATLAHPWLADFSENRLKLTVTCPSEQNETTIIMHIIIIIIIDYKVHVNIEISIIIINIIIMFAVSCWSAVSIIARKSHMSHIIIIDNWAIL